MKDIYLMIELKDGISITGRDPYQLKNMLYEMHSAYSELIWSYSQKKYEALLKNTLITYDEIRKAIETIESLIEPEEE